MRADCDVHPSRLTLLLCCGCLVVATLARNAEAQQPETGAEAQQTGAEAQQPESIDPASTTAVANRLAGESSPYLLQHAHNPVDWVPWGDEAFERAKRENKLVFLSVGYAACHWCHVMERESFVDPEIAAEMNERFVCIKVDREERPDVDQIYMTAVQLISGQGGWPMSVFLTPDARPFWGGTYFPARDGDRGNLSGFLTIVRKVDEVWKTQPDLVRQQAATVTDAIRQNQVPVAASVDDSQISDPSEEEVRRVASALGDQFDAEFGGFGYSEANPNRPKFPEPSNLVFLLDRMTRESVPVEDRRAAERMLLKSLDGMLSGAMWDHLGGGFHRYSVDREWQIPHFEKMLYDNAQLAPIYAEAFISTGREEFRDIAERTCEFVIRELRAEGGAFFSSLDADSEGEEGAYYRWTAEALQGLKQQEISDFELVADVYRLSGPANFEDDFHVPAPGMSITAAADTRGENYRSFDQRLAPGRAAMLAARQTRSAPPTDIKILTAWNGLMIAGLADTGRLLERADFIEAAATAAEFLLRHSRTADGRLLRSYAGGQAKLNGYVDDYAFLASGLLALHRATGESSWLESARALVDQQIEWFWDASGEGFYFTSSDHPSLIVRVKDPVDAALPSGASVSAENLLLLAERTGEQVYRDKLRATLRSLGPLFEALPAGVPRAAVVLAKSLDDGSLDD